MQIGLGDELSGIGEARGITTVSLLIDLVVLLVDLEDKPLVAQ